MRIWEGINAIRVPERNVEACLRHLDIDYSVEKKFHSMYQRKDGNFTIVVRMKMHGFDITQKDAWVERWDISKRFIKDKQVIETIKHK